MYSVKSETKCITTIGTVNSRLAHTLAMRTEAKITFYCRLLLAYKDTNSRFRWKCSFNVEEIFWIRVESFLE